MLGLKRTGAEIVAQGPVIKADEYATFITAQQLLELAKKEADQIVAEAKQEYARQKEQGRLDGIEQGKAEISEQIVATISQSSAYFSKLESTLIDVVIKATRRVIGEFEDRERVERIVRKALELLRSQHSVRLKVPPAQAESLKLRVDALLNGFPRIQFLDVQPDPRLGDGGCILETELGVIDATVETQLKAIQRALAKSFQ